MSFTKIRISGIINESIVDGPGLRYVLFTQGCHKTCYKCHNPETKPLKGGYLENIKTIKKEIKDNPLIKGITFSGGEPFLQAKSCYKIARFAHRLGLDTLSYSGYYYEELLNMGKNVNKFLKELDYLIDGPFDYSKLSLDLLFRGSSNQRIINLKDSRQKNELVFIEKF